ncbi:MAG: hypothetical protein C5B59_17560 [Bacteroidetes bacterium]|nr:MAG: hypothetical protein C5B59_17560 [Bacteroidota bacterium]
MKYKLLAFFILLYVNTRAQREWQQEVNYRIDVTLDTREHSLSGFAKMEYINHSPDTLHFIWFHLWPNAYKNDRTAFSDQLLENGRTDFYFSNKQDRGYINRLDFRVNGVIAELEDHPQHIDIVKLVLPGPLLPGDSIQITTPFFEKLPYNFSRGGHVKNSYQITQWYPKPAVYDRLGWHPMPYLDQGEFYGEFGHFDVRITVPKNYVVAATGSLQNEEEKNWLKSRKHYQLETKNPSPPLTPKKNQPKKKTAINTGKAFPTVDTNTKTIQFLQSDVHDFAWFADQNFIVEMDTLLLPSGKRVQIQSFYDPANRDVWKNSLSFTKEAVHFHSSLIGDYPYDVMNVVDTKGGVPGGMEYPTITAISKPGDEKGLSMTIFHEVGHEWFYGAIGSNERRYPWMDEGINSYYDDRYTSSKSQNLRSIFQTRSKVPAWIRRKFPDDPEQYVVNILTGEKSDQPISSSSEDFSAINYIFIPYKKAALWMKLVADSIGKTTTADSCMRVYYDKWKFKHPYPDDFKATLEACGGKNLSKEFSLLDQTGPLPSNNVKKELKATFLFSARNPEKYDYVNFLPAVGYNTYDKFMVGAIIHNYNLPSDNFQFLLIPLYATGSKQLNGIANMSYSFRPSGAFQKISFGINGMKFSSNAATDTFQNKKFESFSKIVPFIRLDFKKKDPRSTTEKWLVFRTYLINETIFNGFVLSNVDSNLHPTSIKFTHRYLNELSFNLENYRVLYPYSLKLQFQQSDIFYRLNVTSTYFFNYGTKGGMNVRFFAAKFGVWGNNQGTDVTRYQPKLLGTTGEEDYTYGNYFVGRSASYALENESIKNGGFAAQQIMIRDGGLKMRIDQYDFIQGRSDNWVAAFNFNSTLPNNLLPIELPVKLFFDVGTYAEAWHVNPPTSKFLYVGGLQLSLIKNLLNIYIPLVYSSDFSDQLKTIPEQNTFWKKITFSIDIQNFNLKKQIRDLINAN